AKGIKQAIEAHRRAMPYCMGSLYWQINDCWPVASWSSTDYYHKWKAVHYAVKHAYEKVIVSGFITKQKILKTFVVSDKLKPLKGELILKVLKFNGDLINHLTLPVNAAANSSTLVKSLPLNKVLKNSNPTEVVIVMQLKMNEKIIATNNIYPAKPKEQKLPKTDTQLSVSTKNGKTVVLVSSDKLARAVYLNVPNCNEFFSDNYFDILPHETVAVELKGAKINDASDIKVTHLGNLK
ncbi:MAG: beta-mannosidase, partial [Bacteroidia bacterium]